MEVTMTNAKAISYSQFAVAYPAQATKLAEETFDKLARDLVAILPAKAAEETTALIRAVTGDAPAAMAKAEETLPAGGLFAVYAAVYAARIKGTAINTAPLDENFENLLFNTLKAYEDSLRLNFSHLGLPDEMAEHAIAGALAGVEKRLADDICDVFADVPEKDVATYFTEIRTPTPVVVN